MILSPDRIEEMQNALRQRMMIGGAIDGDTNKTATIQTANAEFTSMIIDVSNQLYAANVFSTFGTPVYSYNATNDAQPHQFAIPIGDFRNEV